MAALPAMMTGMLIASPRRRASDVAAIGDGRDRDHVVEAHDDVGDDDDPHRAPEVSTASDVPSASSSCGPTSLTAITDSAQRADQPQERAASSAPTTTPVNTISSTEATPAPMIMPHIRSRGGSPRHAIAITTALSPDSRMLTQMI